MVVFGSFWKTAKRNNEINTAFNSSFRTKKVMLGILAARITTKKDRKKRQGTQKIIETLSLVRKEKPPIKIKKNEKEIKRN